MERIGSDSWDAANGRKLWIGIVISLALHNHRIRVTLGCLYFGI